MAIDKSWMTTFEWRGNNELKSCIMKVLGNFWKAHYKSNQEKEIFQWQVETNLKYNLKIPPNLTNEFGFWCLAQVHA